MAELEIEVQLEGTVGEDLSWQIFWAGDDGAIPIKDPVLADVKDANGQIAMRFATNSDAATAPHAAVNGPAGFVQLTCPASFSRLLPAGKYRFDLFATTTDSAPPFTSGQLRQVISGWVLLGSRTTKIEDASEAILTSTPGG